MTIGLAITFAVAVSGQLCAASLVDHVGFLGTPVRKFTVTRAIALCLAIAGSILSVSYG